MERFIHTHYLKMVYGIVLGSLVYIAFFSPRFGLVKSEAKEITETPVQEKLVFEVDASLFRQRKEIAVALEEAKKTTQIALQKKAEAEEELKRREQEEKARRQAARRQIQSVSLAQNLTPGKQVGMFTAYSCDGEKEGCSKSRKTSSGQIVRPGLVAASPNIPLGTKINVEGIGILEVADRGGAVKVTAGMSRFDVFIPGYDNAKNFGVKYLAYEIL